MSSSELDNLIRLSESNFIKRNLLVKAFCQDV